MKIIKELELVNYRNIKHEKLSDFKDFNILIGPNNSGKSNILNAINLLSDFSMPNSNLICKDCEGVKGSYPIQENIDIKFEQKTDSYLGKGKTEIKFSFDEKDINSITSNLLEELKPQYESKKNVAPHYEEVYKLTLIIRSNNSLTGNHLSVYLHPKILNFLKKNLLFCPDTRLQSYKGGNFSSFINSKKFNSNTYMKWVKAIQELVDPKIIDNRSADLDRKYPEGTLTTTIEEQGSGIRSLVCLLADIMDDKNQKIILLDEPELGLNPFAKHSLLNFLLNISKEKQIFITTQDPTFINPIIWQNNSVGLYLYSSHKQNFVKPDIEQSKNNPDTFAGFLPHTVSLKNIHLYLEGASDVYIYQIFLRRFLKNKYDECEKLNDGDPKRVLFYMKRIGESWIDVFNKIGMYHLCGDFWEHLLYTIPKEPYNCMILLDGDKKTKAKEVINDHNNAMINKSYLKFCNNLKELRITYHAQNVHPVYCLRKDCIEKYLIKRFNPKKPPKGFNKKIDGPRKADELSKIPEEIVEIYDIICFDKQIPKQEVHEVK